MTIGNASLIEILWIIMSLVGVVASGWGSWTARGDYRWVKKHPNSSPAIQARRLNVAEGYVENEQAMLIIQLVFLASGVQAAERPPPATESGTLASLALGSVFVLAALVLIYVNIRNRLRRRRFSRLGQRATPKTQEDQK